MTDLLPAHPLTVRLRKTAHRERVISPAQFNALLEKYEDLLRRVERIAELIDELGVSLRGQQH